MSITKRIKYDNFGKITNNHEKISEGRKMEQVQIRTDLALEARESVSEKEEHLHGVQVEEESGV